MVSGSLALLYFLLGFHGERQGRLGLRHGWLGLRPGWLAGPEGGTDRQTDKQTNGQTENLPILQDFVPYWGRCPDSPHENKGEIRVGQGNR